MGLDTHTVNVSLPATEAFQLALPANSRRIALIFASSNGTRICFNNTNTGVSGPAILVFGGSAGLASINRREFGPIVTGEVWVRTTVSLQTATITEIFSTGG